MVVSIILDVMLYSFVKKTEIFSKEDRLIWSIFVLVVLEEGFCLCACVPKFFCV